MRDRGGHGLHARCRRGRRHDQPIDGQHDRRRLVDIATDQCRPDRAATGVSNGSDDHDHGHDDRALGPDL